MEEGESKKENQGTFGREGRLDSEETRTRVQLSTLSPAGWDRPDPNMEAVPESKEQLKKQGSKAMPG